MSVPQAGSAVRMMRSDQQVDDVWVLGQDGNPAPAGKMTVRPRMLKINDAETIAAAAVYRFRNLPKRLTGLNGQ